MSRSPSLVWGLSLALAVWIAAAQPNTSPSVEANDSSASEIKEPRGYLGFRRDYEEEGGQGRFRIHSVTPDTPADDAGLLQGDVVVAVNGVGFRFSTRLEVYEAFDWLRPGDRVELSVLRSGSPLTIEITATEMPPDIARRWDEIKAEARHAQQNMTLRRLGRGGGVVIVVHRDASTGRFEFSAAGYPRKLFEHTEQYLRVAPPMSRFLDQLKPGDQFKLQVVATGNRLDFHVLDPPPYLEDFSSHSQAQ